MHDFAAFLAQEGIESFNDDAAITAAAKKFSASDAETPSAARAKSFTSRIRVMHFVQSLAFKENVAMPNEVKNPAPPKPSAPAQPAPQRPETARKKPGPKKAVIKAAVEVTAPQTDASEFSYGRQAVSVRDKKGHFSLLELDARKGGLFVISEDQAIRLLAVIEFMDEKIGAKSKIDANFFRGKKRGPNLLLDAFKRRLNITSGQQGIFVDLGLLKSRDELEEALEEAGEKLDQSTVYYVLTDEFVAAFNDRALWSKYTSWAKRYKAHRLAVAKARAVELYGPDGMPSGKRLIHTLRG